MSGELYGFEALARWEHPVYGSVCPEDFIPLAEAADLIDELTSVMVSAAASIAVQWPESLRLAVNVSPLELRDWSLPERLQSAVASAGFPMSRLVVEITESALIGNLDLAQTIAHDLKQAGAKLALDDFGTGFSSLHHLQALPFDEIKVDASFVQSMMGRRETRKIVAAVVGLGISLGLNTIAEGVEKQAQADMLASLGCELGQGWIFDCAVPAVETVEYIAKLQPRAYPASNPLNGDIGLHLEARPCLRLAQLQAIYSGAPVGLCFLDQRLRCISLNRRFAEMHGIAVGGHMGRTESEMLPHLAQQIQSHLYRALGGEVTSNLKLQVHHTEPKRNLLHFYEPARDEAGEVVGISIAALEDPGA